MKKKTIVRVAVIVLAVASVSVFGLFAAGNTPQEADAASSKATAEEKASGDKEVQPKKTENAGTAVKEQETGNVNDTGRQTQSEKTNGGSHQSEPKAGNQEKSPQTSQSTGTDKSEKDENNARGENGAGKSEVSETKPVHTHEWVAVYGERTVEKPEQKFYAAICNQCGLDMSSFTEDAIWDHILNTACSSFSTDVYRDVEVEKREQYISGYACSCGAKKQ